MKFSSAVLFAGAVAVASAAAIPEAAPAASPVMSLTLVGEDAADAMSLMHVKRNGVPAGFGSASNTVSGYGSQASNCAGQIIACDPAGWTIALLDDIFNCCIDVVNFVVSICSWIIWGAESIICALLWPFFEVFVLHCTNVTNHFCNYGYSHKYDVIYKHWGTGLTTCANYCQKYGLNQHYQSLCNLRGQIGSHCGYSGNWW